MKLVSYDRAGSWQAGIVLDSTVFDVSMLLEASGADTRPCYSMSTLLRQYGSALPELSRRLTAASTTRSAGTHRIAGASRGCSLSRASR